MNIVDDQQLLETIEAFLARHKMAPTRFGRAVVGEAGFIERLRGGRSVTLKTANRIVDFMKIHDECLASEANMPSPDNAPENIGALRQAQDESVSPEGEPSGRAPAADSASAAAGVNISAGDAVASEMGEAA